MTETTTAPNAPCANCAATLTGPFCANCGQSVRDLHRPFRTMLADAVGDVFSLDTRFARTLWPLLTRPGRVTKEYLSGRRAAHVPPLRTYLIAALVFFGLFSVFPAKSPPVYLYTIGSAEETLVKRSGFFTGGPITSTISFSRSITKLFCFLPFALVFFAGWLPGFLKVPLRIVLVLWPIVYLPIAVRRVYGGSRFETADGGAHVLTYPQGGKSQL